MPKQWANLREDDKSGFRVRREGPIHVVFLGPKHIGNIIEPVFGSSTGKALKHTAITKNWGIKSTHDSKHSAVEWLKQKHKSHMTTRISEETEHLMERTLDTTDSVSVKDHFQNLYSAHLKTGMAPKHFKSPHHLARIAEIQHGLKSGTYTKHIQEGIESKTIGITPTSRQQTGLDRSVNRVIKKDPATLLKPSKSDSTDSVTETFLRVYKEAKEKLKPSFEKEIEDDGFSVDKPNPTMKQIKKDVFQIKKTDTGEDGVIITIDPPMKNKPGNPDNVTPEHKNKPV